MEVFCAAIGLHKIYCYIAFTLHSSQDYFSLLSTRRSPGSLAKKKKTVLKNCAPKTNIFKKKFFDNEALELKG